MIYKNLKTNSNIKKLKQIQFVAKTQKKYFVNDIISLQK